MSRTLNMRQFSFVFITSPVKSMGKMYVLIHVLVITLITLTTNATLASLHNSQDTTTTIANQLTSQIVYVNKHLPLLAIIYSISMASHHHHNKQWS